MDFLSVTPTDFLEGRPEFPQAWDAFRASAPSSSEFVPLTLELTPDHYPFWSRGRLGALHRGGEI